MLPTTDPVVQGGTTQTDCRSLPGSGYPWVEMGERLAQPVRPRPGADFLYAILARGDSPRHGAFGARDLSCQKIVFNLSKHRLLLFSRIGVSRRKRMGPAGLEPAPWLL